VVMSEPQRPLTSGDMGRGEHLPALEQSLPKRAYACNLDSFGYFPNTASAMLTYRG
jgi:hypothetical protein